MISVLEKYHWAITVSQKWSHIKVQLPSWVRTIIPDHKVLDYGTFNGILKQLEINESEFLNLINSK